MKAVLLNLIDLLERELTEGIGRPDNPSFVVNIWVPRYHESGHGIMLYLLTRRKQTGDYSPEAEGGVAVGAILRN